MKRLSQLFSGFLLSKWLPAFVFGLALLLCFPALLGGLMLDDFPHQMAFQPDFPIQPGGPRGDWDLFRFMGPDRSYFRYQQELGLMPWWTTPTIRLAFLRPLSSLSHALDYRLWPDKPWLMHLESVLIYCGIALLLGRLYRRLLGVTIAAAVAAVMFALDDAHSLPIVWIANRNALWAMLFGVFALSSFIANRRQTFPAGKWLGPIAFGLALLSGEAALGAAAYLFAYVVWMEQGPWLTRLARLWPYVGLGLIWAVAYGVMGYGTVGSGMYIDPVRSPGAYLLAVIVRLPLLLAAQFALPPADLWMQVAPSAQVGAAVVAWAAIALFGFLGYRLLRGDKLSGFFATGMVLSMLPVCSAWPMDRLLLFSGLGAFGLVAQLVVRLGQGLSDQPTARRVLRRLAIGLLLLMHVVLAGLLLPGRIAFANQTFGSLIPRAAASLPPHDQIHGRTLVIVNAPDPLVATYSVVHRFLYGRTLIHDLRLLSIVLRGTLQVTRSDDRTLILEPSEGFIQEPLSRVFRSPSLPMSAGEVVKLPNMTAEVQSVSEAGVPRRVAFHFDRPLSDPQLVWVIWKEHGFVNWVPPAVGQTGTLPAIDYPTALRGK